MKKIAVLNDLSGFGKCSLAVALPIISALGVQCCPVPTAVLSNQTDYENYFCKDLTDDLPDIIEGIKALKPSFDGILTGFISNAKQGKIISDFIDYFKAEDNLIIVDPVMGDDGRIYDSYNNACLEAIKTIAAKADIITPNLTELCILCGRDFNTVDAMNKSEKLSMIEEMCKEYAVNGKRIVVSGIKFGESIANAVFVNGEFRTIELKAIAGGFSGTGDILASIIAAKCVKGDALYNATLLGADFISKAIEKTICDTNGSYNAADGINFEDFLTDLR